MTGRHFLKLYPRDLLGHPMLSKIPRDVRWVLMELICLAHEQVTYGKITAGDLAGYLAGDPFAVSALDTLVKTGVVNVVPGTGDVVFRRLMRDMQKSTDGRLARLKRGDLAGDSRASARVPEARSQKPEKKTSPSTPSAASEDTPRKKGPHVPVVETWIAAWAFYRHDVPRESITGWTFERPDGIPTEKRYVMHAKDWVAAARLWAACPNLVEIRKRIKNLFNSSARWVVDNASLALLESRWNQFDRPIAEDGDAA